MVSPRPDSGSPHPPPPLGQAPPLWGRVQQCRPGAPPTSSVHQISPERSPAFSLPVRCGHAPGSPPSPSAQNKLPSSFWCWSPTVALGGASGPGHPPGLTPAGVHLQALYVLGWEGTRHGGPRPEPRVLLRRAPPPCADTKATVLVPRVPCPQVSTLRDETRRPGRGSRPALRAGRAPGPRGRPVAPTGHAGTARHARGWAGPGPAGLESGHPARVLPPSVFRALATPPPRVGHPVPGALIPRSRSEA